MDTVIELTNLCAFPLLAFAIPAWIAYPIAMAVISALMQPVSDKISEAWGGNKKKEFELEKEKLGLEREKMGAETEATRRMMVDTQGREKAMMEQLMSLRSQDKTSEMDAMRMRDLLARDQGQNQLLMSLMAGMMGSQEAPPPPQPRENPISYSAAMRNLLA